MKKEDSKRVVYYDDDLSDDFAGTNINKCTAVIVKY